MLSYDIVDVFAERPFAGNPLAVVRGADRLGTAQLQQIASEFNLSETAFPADPTPAQRAAGASYQLRIFTPRAELPFAGHPSIGAAWVLHRDGELQPGRVGQSCGIGVVTLHVPADGTDVELSAAPRRVSPPSSAGPALSAAGLSDADAAGQVRIAGCGLDFGYLAVRADAVHRARVSGSDLALSEWAGDDPVGGLCVYSVDSGHAPLPVRARVFCPDVGVVEDAATGSAALGLGLVLAAEGLLAADGPDSYVVRQGVEMGRPSLLRGRVSFRGAAVRECHVAGNVVPVAAGRIAVPAAG